MASASRINSLPPEILARIFFLVRRRLDNSRVVSSSIVKLGSVCGKWRSVSLCTAALWSSVVVTIGIKSSPTRRLERLKLHMERSMGCSLSVMLYVHRNKFLDYDRFVGSNMSVDAGDLDPNILEFLLLNCILQHADRIHHLSLTFEAGAFSRFATSLMPHIRHRFSNLTRFTLDIAPDEEPHEIIGQLSEFSYLRTIEIYRVRSRRNLHPEFWPISNLTNITLDETLITQFTTILLACTHLRMARVVLWEDRLFSISSIVPIPSRPHLQVLDIGIIDQRYLSRGFKDLFDILSFPNLRDLTFSGLWRTEDEGEVTVRKLVQACVAFIERCPRIEAFKLKPETFIDTDVLAILERMPNLIELDITDSNWGLVVTDRFFEELGRGEVVPLLKDLRLDLPCFKIGKGMFEEMLRSRIGNTRGRQLCSAYLMAAHSTTPQLDLEYLRQLQLEGLAVRVVHRPLLPYPKWSPDIELLGYAELSE